MKNILVPIGTSPNSYQTLQYAVDFATEFSAHVFVMEVFSVAVGVGSMANIEKKIEKNAKERLREVIEKVDAKKVEIKIATYKGELADGLKEIDKDLGIDLIIMAPRSHDVNEALYLGPASGSIIKKTNIPALVVPKGTEFNPFKKVLTAFGSGVLKERDALVPLMLIQKKFNAIVSLLLVKRSGYDEEDLKINTALIDISSKVTITEHTNTYLGVIEHFQAHRPELLCVFRRKRGFFQTLWEKNTVPKSEFSSRIPVLILPVKKD